MKNSTRRITTVVISAFLALYLISGVCEAQESSRKGKFDFYGVFESRGKLEAEYSNINRKAEFDSGSVGGIGFGYNFTDNLNLNTEITFGSCDLEGTTMSGSFVTSADTDIFIFNLNLDYNIINKPFSPFVTGGLGSINLSGTTALGSAFDETDFSYNIGGGVRWDISENWFLKVLYKRTWTELEDADDTSDFNGVSLSLGFKF